MRKKPAPRGRGAEVADPRHDRSSAREELSVSERRFRALIEKSWDGLALVDAEGRFLYVSPSSERILGYKPEELIGHNSGEFLLGDLAQRKLAFEEIVRQRGKSATAELRYRHRNGRAIWLEAVRTNLLDDPLVRAVVVNFRDVTERRRWEDEQRRARAEAEAANRAKDDFLATLSHELRSPLSAVLTWVRLLRRGRLDREKAAQALETIERNAQMQVRLIEDLLDVSRIAAGKLALEIALVDLEAVVRSVVESVRAGAEAKRIDLELRAASHDLTVRGDETRLHQVFVNLLSNAIKFTPEGGHVIVDAERADDRAQVVVTDTGIGIEPELIGTVFDRFRQGQQAANRAHGGLGLGLTICKHLVEAHGGAITAQSRGAGQGAAFRVLLPLDHDAPVRSVEPVRDEVLPLGQLSGLRVLVVDDDADVREFLSLLLVDHGAAVRLADSVERALELFRAEPVSVVIADLMMPERDGFELIRLLRQQRGALETPVIALTALAGVEDRKRAARAGFAHFLSKPVDEGHLLAAIRHAAELAAEP
jgi:PAS domain S-box-containing protein